MQLVHASLAYVCNVESLLGVVHTLVLVGVGLELRSLAFVLALIHHALRNVLLFLLEELIDISHSLPVLIDSLHTPAGTHRFAFLTPGSHLADSIYLGFATLSSECLLSVVVIDEYRFALQFHLMHLLIDHVLLDRGQQLRCHH